MIMKKILGLELVGPCSETGARPDPWETVATINDFGRVAFHQAVGFHDEVRGIFTITTRSGKKYLSSEIYLLYVAGFEDS